MQASSPHRGSFYSRIHTTLHTTITHNMDWFGSWFDKNAEVQKIEAEKPAEEDYNDDDDDDDAESWGVDDDRVHPAVHEPLASIEEASVESTSVSTSNTRERRRRDVRSGGVQERDEEMFRSRQSSEDYNYGREDAYRVADDVVLSSSGSLLSFETGPSKDAAMLNEYSQDGQQEEDGGEQGIDLQVVEEYDHAFNEFIAAHPQFVVISPDVVHSLRVCKLQKLLERGSAIEADLQEQLAQIEKSKGRMEVAYQRELKEASRKKAAREVHLASKLAATQKATTAMEAKLLWKLVSTFEASAKKHHRQRELLKNTHVKNDRHSLLAALPQESEFQSIRDAMLVPPSSEPLRDEQKMDMQQFQIDNAILHSEVAVLEKKLKHVKAAAKKHAWVESMLVRMDPKVLQTLKEKYAKSKGVTL